jgi:hypothetical protein
MHVYSTSHICTVTHDHDEYSLDVATSCLCVVVVVRLDRQITNCQHSADIDKPHVLKLVAYITSFLKYDLYMYAKQHAQPAMK